VDIVTACKRFPKAVLAGFSTAFRGVGRGLAPAAVTMQNCQVCGNMRQTKYVAFHRNVGMLFQRQTFSVKGCLCLSCVHKAFWEYTLKNLLLGWWGIISVVITPVYFVMNLFVYLTALYKLRDAVE